MDYTYYSKDIQPSLTLGVMIEPSSIFAKITEGYHSYLTEEMAKGRMYCAEIGIFEIPVGATVYINYAHREVVSTDIKYLGLLEE